MRGIRSSTRSMVISTTGAGGAGSGLWPAGRSGPVRPGGGPGGGVESRRGRANTVTGGPAGATATAQPGLGAGISGTDRDGRVSVRTRRGCRPDRRSRRGPDERHFDGSVVRRGRHRRRPVLHRSRGVGPGVGGSAARVGDRRRDLGPGSGPDDRRCRLRQSPGCLLFPHTRRWQRDRRQNRRGVDLGLRLERSDPGTGRGRRFGQGPLGQAGEEVGGHARSRYSRRRAGPRATISCSDQP